MIYTAVLPQTIAPFSPSDQEAGAQLAAPDSEHIFGTDNLQRDVSHGSSSDHGPFWG